MRSKSQIRLSSLQTTELIENLRVKSTNRNVHFLNSYNIGLAILNTEYRSIIESSFINIIDGIWLLRTIRVLKGIKFGHQMRGIDFLRECLGNDPEGVPYFKTHFFLGSSNEVLNEIRSKLFDLNPQLNVALLSPPFKNFEELNLDEILIKLKCSSPDVIWVGMGTPKQDFIVSYLSKTLSVPVIAVGAAFDFLAESIKESPTLIHRTGFEWLFRFILEPKRLWKRYFLVSPLVFISPFFFNFITISSET